LHNAEIEISNARSVFVCAGLFWKFFFRDGLPGCLLFGTTCTFCGKIDEICGLQGKIEGEVEEIAAEVISKLELDLLETREIGTGAALLAFSNILSSFLNLNDSVKPR
jgi:hypothetical protein